MSALAAPRSKNVATWLAVLGGALGLHRFYLHGFRDVWGWLMPLPTLIGLVGVQRMRQFGGDDHLAWVLIPFLGVTVSIAMISAIVCGLTPDERWNARFDRGAAPGQMGWSTIIGVVVALVLGAGVLMATLAFSAQRYFEYQAETASPDKP
jgi:uncharacterized membrane protein